MKRFSLFLSILILFVATSTVASTISGLVVDSDTEDPIIDAHVILHQMGQGGGQHLMQFTDENGEFLFEDVVAGDFRLKVMAFGYHHYMQELEVGEGDSLNLLVEMMPIGGSFEFGSVSGVVIDAETDEPVPDVRIKLRRLGFPHFHAIQFTNESGEFFFPEAPTGDYHIRARKPFYEIAVQEIEVLEDDTTDVYFELVPMGPPTFGGVDGMITDAETEEPIPHAKVMLRRDNPYPGHPRMRVTFSDSTGYYNFEDALTGGYEVWANRFGYFRSESVEIEVLEDEIMTVDFALAPRDSVFPSGIVTGTVTDEETGDPIADAFVRMVHPRPFRPHFMLITTTDENGNYELEAPVALYDMRSGRDGYQPSFIQDIQIIEDDTVFVDFELTPCDSSGMFAGFSGQFVDGRSSTVQFIDESDGFITDWFWTFGDGTTSSEQNPLHTYEQPGEYIVTLETWGIDGWDMEMKYDYIEIGSTKVDEDDVSVPHRFGLSNYPNPFNPETTIQFQLAKTSSVNLSVYDLSGKLVKKLIDGELYESGYHALKWNGTDAHGKSVSSGMYIYKIESDGYSETKRMILLK